jgi:hypothetical protein
MSECANKELVVTHLLGAPVGRTGRVFPTRLGYDLATIFVGLSKSTGRAGWSRIEGCNQSSSGRSTRSCWWRGQGGTGGTLGRRRRERAVGVVLHLLLARVAGVRTFLVSLRVIFVSYWQLVVLRRFLTVRAALARCVVEDQVAFVALKLGKVTTNGDSLLDGLED